MEKGRARPVKREDAHTLSLTMYIFIWVFQFSTVLLQVCLPPSLRYPSLSFSHSLICFPWFSSSTVSPTLLALDFLNEIKSVILSSTSTQVIFFNISPPHNSLYHWNLHNTEEAPLVNWILPIHGETTQNFKSKSICWNAVCFPIATYLWFVYTSLREMSSIETPPCLYAGTETRAGKNRLNKETRTCA